jgi:hypothetical protein
MKNTKPLPVTGLDFTDLKLAIKEYIKNQTDFNSYDFEGSNLSMLVDILAYNSQFTSYNINMVANELALETSTFRDNVVSLAKRLGYQPKTYTSSKVGVTISSNNVSGYNYLKIYPGTVVTASNEGKAYVFLTEKTLSTTVTNGTASFANIDLSQGQFLNINYVVDYSDENQRFIIPNAYVDSDSITVTVQGQSYTRKKDILGVGPDSAVFFVDQIQDQKLEVIFGDNVVGRKLENGEVVEIQYISTVGSLANGIKSFLLNCSIYGVASNNTETLLSLNLFNLTVESSSSYGGSEFESIRSIKYNAPRYYSAQKRAVTLDDYEVITRTIYPNIDLLRVVGGEDLDPPEYGKVYISIKPSIGETINNYTKNAIIKELKKYTVGSIVPVIVSPDSIDVILYVTMLFNGANTIKSAEDIRSLVLNAISEYSTLDTVRAFEGIFDNNDLQCKLLDLDESINGAIVRPLLRKIVYPIVNQECKYSFCFRNKLRNISGGYTFSTPDGFYVEGIVGKVYIVDDNSGNLLLKKYIGSKLESLGVVGTVDYETGCFEFTIKPTSDTPINIITKPDSPIVTAPPNTYIQPDVPGEWGGLTIINTSTTTPTADNITNDVTVPSPIPSGTTPTDPNVTVTIDDITPEINPQQCY